ncbi:ABC transporter ATP-binding protein [Zafaria sp. Z1313]|uniref:ABC transporter ATP-binding protein n=1 Tax=Zafaria sp. Z1313 TaxID=3423202 RepID=UPI003D3037C9
MTQSTSPRSRSGILWSYARPHARVLVLGLVLALLGSAMGLASPMVTKWILDSLEAGQSLRDPVLVLTFLMVVGAAIGWWQWVLLGTLAERIVYQARERMIRRYFRAKVLALAARPTGELVTRVTSDTVLLREAASSSVIGLINGVVMLIGTLVLMAVLDWPLLVTTAVAVIVVVILFATLMPAIAVAQEKAQEAVGDLGGRLDGALRAIKTVKVSNAEDRQAGTLLAHAASAREHSVRSVRREAMAWTYAWTGIQVTIIVILGYGAVRVAQGEIGVSTLIAFLLYAFGLMGPITELSGNLTTLQSGIAAAGRIRDVEGLELEPRARATSDVPSAGTAPPVPAAREGAGSGVVPGALLELRGVTARYDDGAAPAVDDVTLAFPSRGHTAIVGPSGAGKTTVFSLLLRFVDPASGELLIDGRRYAGLTPAQVRGHFAYVEQETPIIPGTIRENLLFSNPDAAPGEVDAVLEEILLAEKVAALEDGLDTALTESSVSGGQRQRIALARAILSRPRVLLLDEATAQVDGITEAAIQAAIARQAARGAVITIAHRLSTVVDADTIIVMDAGRVVARGTHAELLEDSGLYRGLVEALRIAPV